MEKEVPRRPWWRGGTGGRKKGGEDERPAQTASRQRLLAISRHRKEEAGDGDDQVLPEDVAGRLVGHPLEGGAGSHLRRQQLLRRGEGGGKLIARREAAAEVPLVVAGELRGLQERRDWACRVASRAAAPPARRSGIRSPRRSSSSAACPATRQSGRRSGTRRTWPGEAVRQLALDVGGPVLDNADPAAELLAEHH